jgi:hypothetical protein
MSDHITISYDGLQTIQNNLTRALAEIALVSNSAFITRTLFNESTSGTATSMDHLLTTLVPAATAIHTLLETTITYFQTVIDQFQHWDTQAAIQAYWLPGHTPANQPTEGN